MAGSTNRCCCGGGSCLCEWCQRKSCCLTLTFNGIASCGCQEQLIFEPGDLFSNPTVGVFLEKLESTDFLDNFSMNVRNANQAYCTWWGTKRIADPTVVTSIASIAQQIYTGRTCAGYDGYDITSPDILFASAVLAYTSGSFLHPRSSPDGIYLTVLFSLYSSTFSTDSSLYNSIPGFTPFISEYLITETAASGSIDCSFTTPFTLDNGCQSGPIYAYSPTTASSPESGSVWAACGTVPLAPNAGWYGCDGGYGGTVEISKLNCANNPSGVNNFICSCCPAIPIHYTSSNGYEENHILFMRSPGFWTDAYCVDCSGTPRFFGYLTSDDDFNDYELGISYYASGVYNLSTFTAPIYDGTTFLCPENTGPYTIATSGGGNGYYDVSVTGTLSNSCDCANLKCSGCSPSYSLVFQIANSGIFFACLESTSGCRWENQNKDHFDISVYCDNDALANNKGCESLGWHLTIIDNSVSGCRNDYVQALGIGQNYGQVDGCPKPFHVLHQITTFNSSFVRVSGTGGFCASTEIIKFYEQPENCDCPTNESDAYRCPDYTIAFTIEDEVTPYAIDLIKTSTGPLTALYFWNGFESNPNVITSGEIEATIECVSYDDLSVKPEEDLIYDKYWKLTIEDHRNSCDYEYLTPLIQNYNGLCPQIDMPALDYWFAHSSTCPSGKALELLQVGNHTQCNAAPDLCQFMGTNGTITAPCDGKFQLVFNVSEAFVPGGSGQFTVTLSPGGTVILNAQDGYEVYAFSCYQNQVISYVATGTITVPAMGVFGPEGDTSGVFSDPPYNFLCNVSGIPLYSLCGYFAD